MSEEQVKYMNAMQYWPSYMSYIKWFNARPDVDCSSDWLCERSENFLIFEFHSDSILWPDDGISINSSMSPISLQWLQCNQNYLFVSFVKVYIFTMHEPISTLLATVLFAKFLHFLWCDWKHLHKQNHKI